MIEAFKDSNSETKKRDREHAWKLHLNLRNLEELRV